MSLPVRRLTNVVVMLALSAAVLAPPGLLRPAQAANGVVSAPCNEAAFVAVLNNIQSTGGGTLTFNCGAVTAIILSSAKTTTSTVTIDGGAL